MRQSTDPPTQRRLLCRRLRQARIDAGYTQQRAGTDLGWSTSKLLRIEAGQVGLSRTDLRAMLDLYGVRNPPARCQLEAMARVARRQPWAAFRDVLSPSEQRYLSCEGSALRLRQYEPALVPELLRTDAYARAVLKALALPGTPDQVLKRKQEACLARQAILDRGDRPQLCFVVDEAALHRAVRDRNGGGTIMSDQTKRLHELAGRPDLSLQVLPLSVGPHPGLATPFMLLDFFDADHASLVYLPGRARPVRTATDDVTAYNRVFADLAAAASPPHTFPTVLDQIMLQRADPNAEETTR